MAKTPQRGNLVVQRIIDGIDTIQETQGYGENSNMVPARLRKCRYMDLARSMRDVIIYINY